MNKTKSVFDLFRSGRSYEYLIAVCDGANSARCPVFPGLRAARINWDLPDPAGLSGSYEDKLRGTIQVRDRIRAKVEEFVSLASPRAQ